MLVAERTGLICQFLLTALNIVAMMGCFLTFQPQQDGRCRDPPHNSPLAKG
jgi:hypothetical protein